VEQAVRGDIFRAKRDVLLDPFAHVALPRSGLAGREISALSVILMLWHRLCKHQA
jgi:hypothetical protein